MTKELKCRRIDDKTICLNEITGRTISYEEVSNAVFTVSKKHTI
jgi:hypothetical protein